MRPDPGASMGMSEWAALPAISIFAASPRNRRSVSDIAGASRLCTRESPPAEGSLARAPMPLRTGGKGERIAPITWSPMRSHPRHSSIHASPSPAASSSSAAAVSSRVRCSSAHRPSRKGVPTTAGAWDHERPCFSSSSPRMVGDTTASG